MSDGLILQNVRCPKCNTTILMMWREKGWTPYQRWCRCKLSQSDRHLIQCKAHLAQPNTPTEARYDDLR